MSDFKIRKISSVGELHTHNRGECIECSEALNELGMPYVHDLNTNTIKTVAKMICESANSLICENGSVARPTCGNMACINPKHIECIKITRKGEK